MFARTSTFSITSRFNCPERISDCQNSHVATYLSFWAGACVDMQGTNNLEEILPTKALLVSSFEKKNRTVPSLVSFTVNVNEPVSVSSSCCRLLGLCLRKNGFYLTSLVMVYI